MTEAFRNKTRDERVAWKQMYCTHYDGRAVFTEPRECRAGVKYASVGRFVAVIAGKEKHEDARPCINGHLMPDALKRCPKWQRVTPDEAEAAMVDSDAAVARIRIVMPVVAKWRTWEKDNRVAKSEVIECPVCKGRLHLSQSGYNGHVWGKCETEGCVEWME